MRITHVLRGEDLLDSTHRVLALRRALGHDDQPVYAHTPMILGPGRRQALEAARRGVGGGVPRRRLSAARARELPRAARLGSRRRPRSAHDRRVDRGIRRRAGDAVAGDVRSEEARVDERRAHPSDAARGAGRARCCRLPAIVTAIDSTYRVFERAVALAQERATTLVQIAEQAAFLFVSDDALAIDENSWKKVLTTEQRERSARRGDRVRRDLRVE